MYTEFKFSSVLEINWEWGKNGTKMNKNVTTKEGHTILN